MILHLTPDDKFLIYLQDIFEESQPGKNMWRISTEAATSTFAQKNNNTIIISSGYFASHEFRNDIKNASCVIFHSLWISNRDKISFLRYLPKSIPVIWRGWGYDYYHILEANGFQLYLPETLSYKKMAEQDDFGSIQTTLKNTVIKYCIKIINKRLFSRIDYFSCCIPNDYIELKRTLPGFKAKFLPLNYYSKEDVFLHGNDLHDLSGNDILLGNSSTISNNHIEAIQALSKLGMNGRKVILPLSYGDLHYQSKVINLGKKLLGNSFVPLTEYMSLADYNKIISKCGNILMNHKRQQAIGNISAALLRGGKVFLQPNNPIYKYYTEMGVVIYDINNIKLEQFDADISIKISEENKRIMNIIWARANGLNQAKFIHSLSDC